jgi:hypothetical protein
MKKNMSLDRLIYITISSMYGEPCVVVKRNLGRKLVIYYSETILSSSVDVYND